MCQFLRLYLIVLPTSWILEKTIPPTISFRKLESIIETNEGNVEIIFNKIKETTSTSVNKS